LKRKIAILTGTRADYGLFRPILAELKSRSEFELQLIVTGMHLAAEFGRTVTDIEQDNYPIAARIDMLFRNDSRGAMAKSLAIGLLGITQALETLAPQFLLVLGDRGEMLAGAIAGAHLGVVVAHIHGGEHSGSIDDSLRHAITKLAHIHFPVTPEAAACLQNHGEVAERIFLIGAPGLDDLEQGYQVTREELSRALNTTLSPEYILAVFHPVVGEESESKSQLQAMLTTILATGRQCVLLSPNSDAGRDSLLGVISHYTNAPNLLLVPHVPRRLYLGLMAGARLMIGNSSSGIIEAPSFGLPVINIGNRQKGRTRSDSVIDVSGDETELQIVLSKILSEQSKSAVATPYRKGAARIIADTLEKIVITPQLLTKDFSQ
jgi:UDP-N-acetylglucosamine 2-epimerase (non-hydrolysing)/GDP/UDP-N,N'-diacetylbacillosamine 2-epimerase (hydrolysing)